MRKGFKLGALVHPVDSGVMPLKTHDWILLSLQNCRLVMGCGR